MEKKLSRDSRNVVIVGTILFILATLIFMKRGAAYDGESVFGFPFTFYRYTEAKTTDSVSWEFQPGYIFINYIIALSVSILLIEGIKKMRKQKPA